MLRSLTSFKQFRYRTCDVWAIQASLLDFHHSEALRHGDVETRADLRMAQYARNGVLMATAGSTRLAARQETESLHTGN